MPANSATAGMVDLGAGWRAEWDSSLDGLVDVNTVAIVGDRLIIQKSAEFTQGPSGGVFPTIPITFRQMAPSAINYIVIDDEIITNSTGFDWTGFRMDVLDDGDAVFDPVLTAASGGSGPIGWTINPFTTASFVNSDMTLLIGGGTVPNGGVWFPGDGATDGQLFIAVNSTAGAPFTTFTLKETPLPSPGALLILVGGVGAFAGRRRRN